MSDLLYAPPSFHNINRQRVIFVDFLHANYSIEFDCKTRKATAFSKIGFEAEAHGYPLILLNQPHSSVRLDGRIVSLQREKTIDQEGYAKILSQPVGIGEHTLSIESKIKRKQGRKGQRRKPVKWLRGRNALESIFHMSDLAPCGGFLERYLPSNYNFDHFKITFDVRVKNSPERHRLICNGKVTKLSRNHWKVEFPSFFTSSCPWFHLGPLDDFEVLEKSFKSSDDRLLPLIVYTNSSGDNKYSLEKYLKKARKVLRDLEFAFGPFPHSSVTIFAEPNRRGGMEYAGATATSFKVLRHELDHSYFATSAIPCDGNAGWMDEAIAKWGDKGYRTRKYAPDGRGAKLGGQSEYTRTTNRKAYTIGRKFVEHLDFVLRKRGGMKPFLRIYAMRKQHQSVSVVEFQELLEEFHGKSLQKLFDRYVY